MLPFEFIVNGPPLSHQTQNRERLAAWKDLVRTEAMQRWPPGDAPATIHLRMTVVYFHDGITIRMDNDNLVKPIQDALNNLVYIDDRLITDTQVRKTNLDAPFRVKGMSPVLAEGFCRDREFLYVKIEQAPDHTELL